MAVIEVEIGPGAAPGRFRVKVIDSPVGHPSAVADLDAESLMARRGLLQQEVLASAIRTRGVPETEQFLREAGQALFAGLLGAGGVAGCYRASAALAAERGEELRVVLRIEEPLLAGLPWEAMFDDEMGAYICRRDQLVRHVPVASTPLPLQVRPPLRILGVASSPRGLARLDTDAEKEHLARALARPAAQGLAEVHWAPDATWAGLQDVLMDGEWHVLHYVGHGDFDSGRDEGALALEREDGRADWISARRLVDLLRQARPMPRLVVLNSCSGATAGGTDLFSGTAAALVRGGISAVAAMQYAISDPAAIAFARGFYAAIARGRGVDDAVSSGRVAILGTSDRTLEWVTPVLYLRSRDTRLFDLAHPGAAPVRADDQMQPRQEAVLAAYRAARSTSDWEPVIAQLGALHRQLPDDQEVEKAYQDARLAARYAQGRRAEQEQDWSSAVAHYRTVSDTRPEYRDVAARLGESSRRRDIAALQEQLRAMFTAGEFQAVAGIADRLAELDPAAADPTG